MRKQMDAEDAEQDGLCLRGGQMMSPYLTLGYLEAEEEKNIENAKNGGIAGDIGGAHDRDCSSRGPGRCHVQLWVAARSQQPLNP